MSFSYTPVLHMALPSDGEESWGDEVRANFEVLAKALAPTGVYYVSPAFTTTNLGNSSATSRRFFDTIQGAVTAFETDQGSGAMYGAIVVFPGTYAENLAVTKRVALFSPFHQAGAVAYGGQKPTLRGASGQASPLVTFTPAAGVECHLTIKGFNLQNDYDGDTGTELAWPHILQTVDQGSGNYGPYTNRIKLENCDLRLAIPSLNDSFESIFSVNAWHTLKLHNCQVAAISETAYHHTRIFKVRGNLTTAKKAALTLERTRLQFYTNGAITGQMNIDLDNGADAQVYDCTFCQSRAESFLLGSNGSNSILGMNSDVEAVTWKNTFGLNALSW